MDTVRSLAQYAFDLLLVPKKYTLNQIQVIVIGIIAKNQNIPKSNITLDLELVKENLQKERK